MNETPLCLLLEMRSGSAVTLFGTIFLDGMAQNQAVVLYSDNESHLILTSCLLNCCIKLISHLQTQMLSLSVYRDLWAHRKRSESARVSSLSF